MSFTGYETNLPRLDGSASTGPWRVLLCPNAFKGSLTALEAASAIEDGANRAFEFSGIPSPWLQKLPLADGGDGILDTLVEATHGQIHTACVSDPLGRPLAARWGTLGGDDNATAVLEMAEASGLRLLADAERNAGKTCTYGTGELIREALAAGCHRLLIGIGGSATNDGGAGMARALGFQLLDAQDEPLPPGGLALAKLSRIDSSQAIDLHGIETLAACDVDNPLCGPEGASVIYGPQKGATPEMAAALDRALERFAEIVSRDLGVDVRDVPGAGAAGGLGAGLLAFLGAKLRPGTELALQVVGFERALTGCNLVITGEGRLDSQTSRGKVICGVARLASHRGVPVVALVGSLEPGCEETLRREGLQAVMCLLPGPMPVEEAMRDAYRLLGDSAERLFRFLIMGARLPGRFHKLE